MENLFISYEIALKLKENGFNEPCLASYYLDGKIVYHQDYKNRIYLGNMNNNEYVLAPLYQQVIDWFREKQMYVIIFPYRDEDFNNYELCWSYSINDDTDDDTTNPFYVAVCDIETNFKQESNNNYYYTYYDALNKAIEEALNLLKESEVSN